MIKAVLFDMDGLLIDSEPLWRKAEIEIFPKVGIPITYEECEQTAGLRIDEVIKFWYNQKPWDNLSLEEVEHQIVDRLIELIIEEGQPLEGVDYILNFFESENIKAAIASSSSYRIIDTVLDKLNIRPHFKQVHSAQDESHGKPHPAVFLNAANKMNTSPENCLVFEDSLNGVISAKAARMKVVAIPEEMNLNNSKFNISDLILTSLKEFDKASLTNLFA